MVSMKKLIVLFLIPILLCCETGAEEVFNKTLNLELLKEYEKSEREEIKKETQGRGIYTDNFGNEKFFKCSLVNNYDTLKPIDQKRYNNFCKNSFNKILSKNNPASWDSPLRNKDNPNYPNSWDSPYRNKEREKDNSYDTCKGMFCLEPKKRNYNDCMRDRESNCGDMRLDPEKVGEQYKKNVEKRCMDYQKDFCSRFK